MSTDWPDPYTADIMKNLLVQRYNELKKEEKTLRKFTPEYTKNYMKQQDLEDRVENLAKDLLGEQFYDMFTEILRDKEWLANQDF